MSVKTRLAAFVADNVTFRFAHYDTADAEALLELVEAVEGYLHSTPDEDSETEIRLEAALSRITED